MSRKRKPVVSYEVLPLEVGTQRTRYAIRRLTHGAAETVSICRDPKWAARIAQALTDEEEYV